jgi:hypothetical protein
MAIRTVKKVKFLKGATKLATVPKFPGIGGPRYAASGSNNRRVRVRGR